MSILIYQNKIIQFSIVECSLCFLFQTFILQLEGKTKWKLFKPLQELPQEASPDLELSDLGEPTDEFDMEVHVHTSCSVLLWFIFWDQSSSSYLHWRHSWSSVINALNRTRQKLESLQLSLWRSSQFLPALSKICFTWIWFSRQMTTCWTPTQWASENERYFPSNTIYLSRTTR